MAETYGFFNAVLVEGVPDRAYSASDFAKYFAAFLGDGVFAHNLNELQVVPNAELNLSAIVKSGRAFCKGYWYDSTSDIALSFSSNSASTPRYDAVVIEFNFLLRTVEAKAVTGVNAASYSVGKSGVYRNLLRTSTIYQLCLAIVKIPSCATTYQIAAADIDDVRDEEYCGWVTGLVDQLDTSSIVTQLQAEFETWFNAMKGQLSEDAAGNLQLQINVLSQELMRQTPVVLYEWDAENDEQGERMASIQLSENPYNYDELEFYVAAPHVSYQSTQGRACATFKKIMQDSYDVSEPGFTLYAFKTFGYRLDMYEGDYVIEKEGNSYKIIVLSNETLTLSATSSGENAIMTGSGGFDAMRIIKIVGHGNRNTQPIIFNSYSETRVDTVSDSVEEVTQ